MSFAPKRFQTFLAATAVFVGLATVGSLAGAQDVDQWNRNKGDCEYVLKAPDRYPLDSIKNCTMMWEQYRNVTKLSPDEKRLYARGFSWLFLYGDASLKALAQGALNRIQQKPLVLQDGQWIVPGEKTAVRPGTEALQPLPRVAVREVSKGKKKKAKRANSKGHRKYKKRRYAQAIGEFQNALKIYPHYVTAKYNLACNQALVGDREGSLRTLLELQSWDSAAASGAFANARVDKDFAPLHSDERFRKLVGLVRIQLLNGAKEPGLYHVGEIHKKLTNRKMPVAQYGYDRHIRQRPFIWYRKGYVAQANIAKEIVANFRTSVREITWDTPFDIIISYGDPDVANDALINKPLVQGEKVGNKGDAAADLLNTVKDAKGKVDETAGTATDAAKLPGAQ